MGLKPDFWIREQALEAQLIDPFVDGQIRDGVVSYGLSSYGYDIRVADEFKVFTPGMGEESHGRFHGGCLHHSAELLCSGAQP